MLLWQTPYLLTHYMVHSPSWEANWFAASQEMPRISRNPKVQYRAHKLPPPVPILGQPNAVHTPTSHLLEIQPNIIHPSTTKSRQWSLSLRFPHQDLIPSMWNKKPTGCHLVLYLFLLYNLPNMFRATLCPSSTADDLWYFVSCGIVPWLCRRFWPPTQPRHYTTRIKNTTNSSATEDGHNVARNMLSTLRYVLPNGHTRSQPVLTAYTATALHHTRQNTTKSSAPEDGHKVARNMLSNL